MIRGILKAAVAYKVAQKLMEASRRRRGMSRPVSSVPPM